MPFIVADELLGNKKLSSIKRPIFFLLKNAYPLKKSPREPSYALAVPSGFVSFSQ